MPVFCGNPTPEFVPPVTPGVLANVTLGDQSVAVVTDRPKLTTAKGSKKTSQAGGDQKSLRLEKLFPIICDIIAEENYWISHRKLRDILFKRTGEWFDRSAIGNFRDKHNLPRVKRCGVKGVITDEPIAKGQRVTNWQFAADIVKMKAMVAKGARLKVSKFRFNFKRKNFIGAIKSGRFTFTQACKYFGVPTATGAEWMRDFRETGRLEQLPRGGDKRSTDLIPYHDSILVKAKADGQLTVMDFVTWLQEEHQQLCSFSSMERTLKQLGISYQSSTVRTNKPRPSVPLIKPTNQAEREHADVIEDNDVALPEGVELSAEQLAQYDARAAVVDQYSPSRDSISPNIKRLILHEDQVQLDALIDTCSVFTNKLNRKAMKNNVAAMLYMIHLAMVSGCQGYRAVAIFVFNKFPMLKMLLGDHAPSRPPKHSTFHNFTHYLNPKEYRRFFIQFTKRCRQRLGNHWRDLWYSFDSKANRGTKKGPNQVAIYTASIMGHTTRETVAILESGLLAKEPNALIQAIEADELPLDYLNLTADALNCKVKLAKLLHKLGRCYVFAVKTNNSRLDTWVRKKFGCYGKQSIARYYELDKKHNKVRICCVLAIPPSAKRPAKWEEIQTIIAYATGEIVEDEELSDLSLNRPMTPIRSCWFHWHHPRFDILSVIPN